MKKKTCIAVVPSPGLSHLIPLVEFTKLLIQQHNEFHVTFLIPTLDYPLPPSMQSILKTLPPSNIDFTILPQVLDLPKNLSPAPKMKLTVKHSIPFLQAAVKSLISQTNLVALVFDIFATDAHDVAKQFSLPSYFFFAPGAFVFSSFLSFPNIDKTVPISSEFLASTYEQVNIPGSVIPFNVKDLPDPLLAKRSSETYTSFLDLCQKISLVDGVIVNTFKDLEPEAIRALQELQRPCVYPIGPIIRSESDSETNMLLCLEWLNNQPQNSVLYVSFGSVGTLSHEQLNELAFGLEMSSHKFLWVVRPPNKSTISAYIGGQKGNNTLEYLPSGFLDRTKEQGLVVPSWAPQIEVLGHGSTGGFLSHCGWSSTLESVVNGVPLIAWPLFAEQNMNAIILTDLLKVAVRPKVYDDGESGLVKREEVAKAIKTIMEGEESLEMRKRMKEMSDAAAAALSEHGSSRKALSTLASKWHNNF